MKNLVPAILAVLLIISCEPSTKIVSSWHDPSASADIKSISKILVIALVKNEVDRRVIEDKLVSLMKIKGVQSYTYLTDEMIKDDDDSKLNDHLKSDGFNGVLIMRLVDIEKETSYVQGSSSPAYYGSYYGYYRYASPMYYNPGYYQTDKHYTVETTVYSTSPDKLIWSATTKTINPTRLDQTTEEIAASVAEKMKQDGFAKD